MMGALRETLDRLLGRGGSGVTIPVMDGPFKPNRHLDESQAAAHVPAIDNIVSDGASLFMSSGSDLLRLTASGPDITEAERHRLPGEITSLATGPNGSLAAGIAGRGVTWCRGAGAWSEPTDFGRGLRCVTALAFVDAETLVVANGSAEHGAGDWKRDLMSGGRTGSVSRCDITGGGMASLASGLAFPYGLVVDDRARLLVSESWRHRITALDLGGSTPPSVVLGDLPAYPARLSRASDGGFWVALFAPRNQLVEFILQEDGYRQAMMADIDPDAWVAPTLCSGGTIDSPLQAGAVRQMGILKPWAPSLSYGLVLSCDPAMIPRRSWHSRTGGMRHGVTSACDHAGALFVAAKGADTLVRVELASSERGRS